MNGDNKTLSDLRSEACAYGIASRAVQDERDSTTDKRLTSLEGRMNKLWVSLVPSILSLLGVIVTILILMKKL